MRKLSLYLIPLAFLLIGCNKNKYKDRIELPIVVSFSNLEKYDCHTRYTINENKQKYKMLLYLDARQCLECTLRQQSTYEDFAGKNGLGLITVVQFSQKQKERLNYYLKSLKCKSTILLDSSSVFLKKNKELKSLNSKVYLLNMHNQLIIKGDPITNKDIAIQYKKLL